MQPLIADVHLKWACKSTQKFKTKAGAILRVIQLAAMYLFCGLQRQTCQA